MKILQVITKSSLGGAQSVVVNLANTLSRMGHEVAVAAGVDDGKMWNLLDSEVKRIPCQSLQRSVSPLKDARALMALHRIYRKFKPDVIHLHSSKAGMLGRMAFPKSRVVYTVHGFDSIRLAFKAFLPIEKKMQRRCGAIVGVSKHDERTMRECGIHRNVTYVYNGIPTAEYDSTLKWNVPTDRYKGTVLCIARLSAQKKHELFLQVAEVLPDYAFVWIGNQYEVKEHPDNVYFLGNVPNAGRYCQLSDLFILPSNYEGLPMVILEAMSYKLPVVASNVGGVSELVLDGKNGYAVENTVSAFKNRISEILDDKEKYRAFSEFTIERFNRKFTVEHMVGNYLEIYNRM